ncbi:precorrin-2 C(20)-methyltransferase [bacterium]|nr:precorrin-2 C(20)-methyltransferase [bacterium]
MADGHIYFKEGMMGKIYLIGIGYRPFDARAREIICSSAMIILSSDRLLDVLLKNEDIGNFPNFPKDKVTVIAVGKIINAIRSALSCQPSAIITILCSGDPLFFGIGRKIIGEFGREMVEILPDLSSIQAAFARIRETWDDAFLMSLHGISDPKRLGYGIRDVPSFLIKHNKMAILTDRMTTPSVIAKILDTSPLTDNLPITMYVCERLGCKDERVVEGKPQGFIDAAFSEPSVVILKLQNSGSKHQTLETKSRASLFVIGVGPGDPELLTLKAIRILNRVSCICVPRGKEEGKSLALSIVEGALNLEGKEIISAYFPMRKTRRQEADEEKNLSSDSCEMDAGWQKIADSILDRINKGMDVAFITLGDPTLYSTFFYICDRLLNLMPEMDIQIIPGVSSITAAASRLKIPLGLADEKIAILPANYAATPILADNLKKTLQQFDTVILMKVHKVFGDIVKALTSMGMLDRATYISRAGMEDEAIFKDIRDVKAEDLNYFSMVIVRSRISNLEL